MGVVIQESPNISTSPAWHLTTRKTAENSDKGIADATASQQPAEILAASTGLETKQQKPKMCYTCLLLPLLPLCSSILDAPPLPQ